MAAVTARNMLAAQLLPAAPSVGGAVQHEVAQLSQLLPQALGAEWCFRLQHVRHKLAAVIASVGALVNSNLCLMQIWFDAQEPPTRDARLLLRADPQLALLCDPLFAEFRRRSCRTYLPDTHGMPGRVWHTGCCTVVQNIHIIPPSLHPRSRLGEPQIRRLSEVVYVPVFDPSSSHPSCPVAVLEAFCAADATDSMLVANLISFIGSLLTSVQLSLSSPAPQPVLRSSLAGRRSKPPAEQQGEQQHAQRQQGAQQHAQQQQSAQQSLQEVAQQQPQPLQHPSLPPAAVRPVMDGLSAAAAVAASSSKRPSDGTPGDMDDCLRPLKKTARTSPMLRTKSVRNLLAGADEGRAPAPTKPAQSC